MGEGEPPLTGKLEKELGLLLLLRGAPLTACCNAAWDLEGVGEARGGEGRLGREGAPPPCWRLLRTSRGSSVAEEEGEALRRGLAWVGGRLRTLWADGLLDLAGAAWATSWLAWVLPLETG